MPGIKITDEDRHRIDAKFICTSCKLLLYLPMQTTCGHLMCQSCIETLLKYDSLLSSFSLKRFCLSRYYMFLNDNNLRWWKYDLHLYCIHLLKYSFFARSSNPQCPEDDEALTQETVSELTRGTRHLMLGNCARPFVRNFKITN